MKIYFHRLTVVLPRDYSALLEGFPIQLSIFFNEDSKKSTCAKKTGTLNGWNSNEFRENNSAIGEA
jgi:hypothetical protein